VHRSRNLTCLWCTIPGLVLLVSAGCEYHFSGGYTGGYTFDYKGDKASRTESGEIAASVEAVEITNRFGSVEVVATDGEAGWLWEGSCWADGKEEAELMLSDLKLEVSTEGAAQRWEVTLPEQGKTGLRGVKSNIKLRVPAGIAVRVGNEHGDSTCRDLTGKLDVGNAHGNVLLTGTGGETSVVNRHGDTEIRMATGSLQTDTAHGELMVSGSSAAVEIRSQFGDVVLDDVTGDVDCRNEHGKTRLESSGTRIECESSFGDVEVTVENAGVTLIDIANQHGDIELSVPTGVKARVTMETERGETESELESDASGTAEIRLTNQFGDIEIRAK
jgi:Putative adhesin